MMQNVGKAHDTVRVVNDQIGTSTYTYNLARLLVDMNETEKYGYYHTTSLCPQKACYVVCTSRSSISSASWYALCTALCLMLQLTLEVILRPMASCMVLHCSLRTRSSFSFQRDLHTVSLF